MMNLLICFITTIGHMAAHLKNEINAKRRAAPVPLKKLGNKRGSAQGEGDTMFSTKHMTSVCLALAGWF